jgi:large subunit ribosomal protein L29
MMKAEKIRGIDAADIQRQVQDAEEQLFRLRFQMGMGQSEGLKKYRSLRKERARMLTVLREKEIGGETLPVVVTTAPVSRKTPAPKAKRGLAGLFRRKKK